MDLSVRSATVHRYVGVGVGLVRASSRPTPGIMGTRMNSALSENEGSIFVDTRPFLECSISRFELIRQ